MTEALLQGQAHLWLLPTAHLPFTQLRQQASFLLAPGELDRFHRYRNEAARNNYLAGRFAVRLLLSRYAPVLPESWVFSENAHGRPEISSPKVTPELRFNLSHTRGLVVFLIASEQDVGVDVENLENGPGSLFEVADRFFSPQEAAQLRKVAPAQQRDRFFEYWTLKESYIKARGIGLSLGLSGFSFSKHGEIVSIAFAPGFVDNPEGWHFQVLRPPGPYIIAATIERKKESTVTDSEKLLPRDATTSVLQWLWDRQIS